MKFKSLISYLLLLLLFLSLVPYNAIHQHTDEVHRIAMVGHEQNHHCELDSYACQDELLQNHACQHPQHLKETKAECFYCLFHFSHFYELQLPLFLNTSDTGKSILFGFIDCFPGTNFIYIFNKGPPQLFI